MKIKTFNWSTIETDMQNMSIPADLLFGAQTIKMQGYESIGKQTLNAKVKKVYHVQHHCISNMPQEPIWSSTLSRLRTLTRGGERQIPWCLCFNIVSTNA